MSIFDVYKCATLLMKKIRRWLTRKANKQTAISRSEVKELVENNFDEVTFFNSEVVIFCSDISLEY